MEHFPGRRHRDVAARHPALTQARLSRELSEIPRRRRDRDFVKLTEGLWLPAEVERDVETLSVAYSRLYPRGVLTGWSAATLHGFEAPATARPELCVGPHGRRRGGLTVRRYEIPAAAVTVVHGVRVTSLRWTAFDLARFCPPLNAVLALEQFYRGGLSPESLGETVEYLAGSWGAARARRAIAAADPLSESPMETETRVLLRAAGFTTFRSQVVVPELGYRLDLADERRRIAVEYDGAWHRDGAQQSRDGYRRNRLQSAGWIVIVVTAGLLRHRAAELLRQVGDAVRRVDARAAA